MNEEEEEKRTRAFQDFASDCGFPIGVASGVIAALSLLSESAHEILDAPWKGLLVLPLVAFGSYMAGALAYIAAAFSLIVLQRCGEWLKRWAPW